MGHGACRPAFRLAVVAVAACLLGGCSGGDSEYSPGSAFLVPGPYGQVVLWLRGRRPARIISVTTTSGRPTGRPVATVAVRRRCHPRPAAGAVIRPTSQTRMELGLQVIIGYRFDSAQHAIRRGVRIRSEIDGQKYEQTLQSAVAACPRSVPQPRCGVWAQGVIG